MTTGRLIAATRANQSFFMSGGRRRALKADQRCRDTGRLRRILERSIERTTIFG